MRAAAAVLALLIGTTCASAQESAAPGSKPIQVAALRKPVPARAKRVQKPAAPKPAVVAVPVPLPKPAPAARGQQPAPAPEQQQPAAAREQPAVTAELPQPIVPREPPPAATANQSSPAPANPRSRGDAYAGIPLAERIAIQSDLIWTGDYSGVANGDFDDRTVAAIKAFQKRFRSKETGILNPQERPALAAAARERRDTVGWRMIDDPVGGGRVAVPGKLLSPAPRGKSGSRWTSAHGETVVETFRAIGTLAAVFEQQRREPVDRRVEYNLMKDDFFVISGLQGLKIFRVRAQAKDGEVHGVTVLYDQAVEGTMEKVATTISSTFVPFSPTGTAALLAAPPSKRNVEYGTGIVVTGAGDIIADRQTTEGCQTILVPKLGNAERVAEDQASNLALLRVYGARDLRPMALAGEATPSQELTLIGVADPQAQSGGGAVSTASARLGGGGNAARLSIDPTPALGFSGAAAINNQGQFLGMVTLRSQVIAGAGPATLPPGASVVTAETIRSFLDAQGVHAVPGRSSADDAKAAVVRVICVRK